MVHVTNQMIVKVKVHFVSYVLMSNLMSRTFHLFARWLPCAANGNAARNVKPASCYDEPTATYDEPTAGVKLSMSFFYIE